MTGTIIHWREMFSGGVTTMVAAVSVTAVAVLCAMRVRRRLSHRSELIANAKFDRSPYDEGTLRLLKGLVAVHSNTCRQGTCFNTV